MQNKELGQMGEDAAAEYLLEDGWTVLERNFRIRAGEIDIIAERIETTRGRTRRVVAIVEVKTRRPRRNLPPELSVTYRKRKTIIRVANAWVRTMRIRNAVIRFDVIAVEWGANAKPEITHIPAAFDGAGNIN
jgi:putative endonuclease